MATTRLLILVTMAIVISSLTTAVSIGNHQGKRGGTGNHDDEEEDHHGGIKMGVINTRCDNAEWNLDIDWVSSSDYEYTCQPEETRIPTQAINTEESCVPEKDIPWPIHKCMTDQIEYEESIPIGGPHRPLWPVYGEYQYAPPQRWLHSMEHGAAVFLYHPCADVIEVESLKSLAKGCLRRHIISPSRRLSREQPFAVVTWGCKLLMSSVDQSTIVKFVRTHAIKTDERTVTDHGQYDLGLLHKAELVSDLMDTDICPSTVLHNSNGPKLTAEDMDEHLPY